MAKSKRIVEKEETGPNGGVRKIGIRTGYEVKDGKYYIAPCYRDEFLRYRNERVALDQLLQAVLSHVAQFQTAVVAAERKLWDEILADFGLTDGDDGYWQYSFSEKCLVWKSTAGTETKEEARLKVMFADALRSVKGR